MTYQELIYNALVLCGRIAEGQVVDGLTEKTAINKINNILGIWEGEEYGAWTEQEYKYCITPGKPTYTVGVGGDIETARAVNIVEMRTKKIAGAVEYKGTTTIAAFLALSSGTEGDYYQFTDSNDTIGYDDYGVLNTDITVTITSADYDIITDDGIYIDLSEYKKYDFQRLPNKNKLGTPVTFHYEPPADEDSVLGTLFIWGTGTAGDQLLFTAYLGWDKLTTGTVTGNINFPKSWRDALEYTLAFELGMIYATPPDKLSIIKSLSDAKTDAVIGSTTTDGGITFYYGAGTTN